MAPEQLLSDRDSEDELDEDLAVLEDRRVSFLPISQLVVNMVYRMSAVHAGNMWPEATNQQPTSDTSTLFGF